MANELADVATTKIVRYFAKNERGVTSIEYGLIAFAISAAVIFIAYGKGSFVQSLGEKLNGMADAIKTALLTVNDH
ncbi:hypothetical protein A6A19_03350 [Actinobacillus delphinicola]|uniref:Flp family type IVb pilin n=1 Tax=Actinobacillus delphinicola TaxID=51161 RepID=UPI0024411EA8|nr:Flp family type IVb pilin [Actinobacillus delphinicola]MDG6897060.1 hypothetical protein [Actinobacillus delphinicola]